ncbi:hypothetical protein Thermo_02071 [Thermoplasmatales archaeon]|nr:hypothetical protein Thermo_02071 [Thermoplasmatales archaeon]
MKASKIGLLLLDISAFIVFVFNVVMHFNSSPGIDRGACEYNRTMKMAKDRTLKEKQEIDILNLYLHAKMTREKIPEMCPDLAQQTISNIIEKFIKNRRDAKI